MTDEQINVKCAEVLGKPRILVWFSCGVPSAVASKMTINHFGESHEVLIVNCDTRPSENSDNYRFSAEVEKWIGQPIVYIKNDKYETVDDVFTKERFMSSPQGARCTTELKKIPRQQFAQPDDIHVFGFTYDERGRRNRFVKRNPELHLKWILIELEMSKADCMMEIRRAGIRQPLMYELGFDNNNCPGCVKSKGAWYWDRIRLLFPDVFKRRCEQSRAIGCRLVSYGGRRIFLDELPFRKYRKPKRKENLSCGPECGIQTKLFQPILNTTP